MRLKFNNLIFVLMFFALFNPISVKASCTYSELSDLKKIASNINVSYDSYMENDIPKFNVFFNNLNDKLYIKDTSTGNIFTNHNTTLNELVLNYFKEGTTSKIEVYSYGETCHDYLLYTTYVVLPSYNKFYGNSLCEGIEDYKLCQKWVSNTMTYKDFYNDIKKYKKSLEKQEMETQKEKVSVSELILNFIYDYGIIIGVSLLIIYITVFIVRYIKRDRFKYLK